MTTKLRLGVAALVIFLVSACTPQQWIRVYFPSSEADKATQVATCESGLNPSAMSPDGSNHGLFQINNVHRRSFERVTGRSWAERYHPGYNTMFAHWLWAQQGWRPWTCG